jgi:hypothetical protein
MQTDLEYLTSHKPQKMNGKSSFSNKQALKTYRTSEVAKKI